MKILLCAPNSGFVGGITKWTNNLENYYKNYYYNRDIDLRIFSTSRKRMINTHTKILSRIVWGIVDYLPLLKKYSKEITMNKYDLIHIASSASIGLLKDILMLKKARIFNMQTIIHFHFGRIPDIFKERRWEYNLLLKAIKLASQIIVIDKLSYDTLVEAGYSDVVLLSNPLSIDVQNIIQLNSDVKKISRKIVFAGHVIVTKGIIELIESCKGFDNIEVKIIGRVSNDMRRKIIKLVGNSPEWLVVTGEMDYAETIKEMMSAKIFVLPSYTEGFPNVILESMACGCAIVATDVGAIPQMLDIHGSQVSGICVKPKDIDQLKCAIEKMLENNNLAHFYSKNAKQRVNNIYTTSKIWDNMRRIWINTIEKGFHQSYS